MIEPVDLRHEAPEQLVHKMRLLELILGDLVRQLDVGLHFLALLAELLVEQGVFQQFLSQLKSMRDVDPQRLNHSQFIL